MGNRERVIRKPMSVYCPGVTEERSVCPTPVIIEDLFPTILEIAGAKKSSRPRSWTAKTSSPCLKGGSEKHNLTGQQPDGVRTMTDLLKERKIQMPTYKKNNPAGAG